MPLEPFTLESIYSNPEQKLPTVEPNRESQFNHQSNPLGNVKIHRRAPKNPSVWRFKHRIHNDLRLPQNMTRLSN